MDSQFFGTPGKPPHNHATGLWFNEPGKLVLRVNEKLAGKMFQKMLSIPRQVLVLLNLQEIFQKFCA